jgi:ABC-type phosphate/phosphonate transport system substrate-binding protein
MLFLLSKATFINSAPIPDRYHGGFPDIGYFGRMEDVLYSADVIDTTIATNMVINKIFGSMGMAANIKFYADANKLKQDLTENRIDAISVNIFDYFSMKHLINQDYVYALSMGQDFLNKTILLNRKNQKIKNLEDLEGQTITIPRGHYLGKYYLDLELIKRGLPVTDNYFSHIREVGDINSAIIDLFFGKTDCALATDTAFDIAGELNKQIPNELKILLASNEMVPQVIALNKNISNHIIQKVDHHILNAHKNQRIKNLLSLFHATKFIKLKKKQIEESHHLILEYKALMNN